MINWQQLLADSARTGAIATAATTLAAAACGRRDGASALAPINAISHIAWGDEAASQTALSGKYTLTGLALNAVAITGWAAIYHGLVGSLAERGDPTAQALAGPAVSALAYVTDYHVVPARLTPGFEKRLSSQSMWCVYSALAVGLALGGLSSNWRNSGRRVRQPRPPAREGDQLAAASMADRLRSTSSSVVAQLETLIRIARRPPHAVGPHQHAPDR